MLELPIDVPTTHTLRTATFIRDDFTCTRCGVRPTDQRIYGYRFPDDPPAVYDGRDVTWHAVSGSRTVTWRTKYGAYPKTIPTYETRRLLLEHRDGEPCTVCSSCADERSHVRT